jgi:hypothetical protein
MITLYRSNTLWRQKVVLVAGHFQDSFQVAKGRLVRNARADILLSPQLGHSPPSVSVSTDLGLSFGYQLQSLNR